MVINNILLESKNIHIFKKYYCCNAFKNFLISNVTVYTIIN